MVHSLDLAAGDLEGCMGNDSLEVLVLQPAEPEKMTIACGLTDANDVNDLLCHTRLVHSYVCLLLGLLRKYNRPQSTCGLVKPVDTSTARRPLFAIL